MSGLSREGFSPRASRSLALPIPAGTPRNAPTAAGARNSFRASLRVRRFGDSVTLTRHLSRCGTETARLPRSDAASDETSRAAPRPFPRIAPSAGCGTRHRRPALSHLSPTPFLRSLIAAWLHSAPSRRPLRSRQLDRSCAGCARARLFGTLKRRGAFGCSLSLHRSHILSQRSLSPLGCLIIAPALAGGPAARAPRPVRASRYCSPSLRSTLR